MSSPCAPCFRGESPRRGFTLIEMLVTVAVLIILLGLMVSLARYVRNRSAELLTKDLLLQLDELAREYAQRTGQPLAPLAPLAPVTPLVEPGVETPSEASLQAAARKNNADVVRLLRGQIGLPRRPDDAPGEALGEAPGNAPGTSPADGRVRQRSGERPARRFGELPISLYDEVTLRDAWGSPIAYMPAQHPAIGLPPRDRPSFFFSAGPDGKYLTRDDNLYSYEVSGARR